ncbi:MAG: hypothetical protein MJ213_02165 [Bacilli bacterium]|nr:hypothetical protein [Bacilli bacterium]
MFCEYRGGKYVLATKLPKDFVDLSMSMWGQKFFYGYGGGSCFAFATKDVVFYGLFDGPHPSVDETEQLYALLSEFISYNGNIYSFTLDAYGQNTNTLEKYYFTVQFTKKKGKLYNSAIAFNVIADKPTGNRKEIQRTVNKKPEATLCEENSPLKSVLGRVLDLLK